MSSSSSPIELTILSIKSQDSHVQDKIRHCAFEYLYVHHAASHVYVYKKKKEKKKDPSFTLSFNLVKIQD